MHFLAALPLTLKWTHVSREMISTLVSHKQGLKVFVEICFVVFLQPVERTLLDAKLDKNKIDEVGGWWVYWYSKDPKTSARFLE